MMQAVRVSEFTSFTVLPIAGGWDAHQRQTYRSRLAPVAICSRPSRRQQIRNLVKAIFHALIAILLGAPFGIMFAAALIDWCGR